MATSNTTQEVFSSLSGADIHAVFGNYKFGSIQMIRYSSSREKAFIYTLGSPSARATARGKRSVSGAFVFTLIDRKGLAQAMSEAAGTSNDIFLSNDERANYANYGNKVNPTTDAVKQNAWRAGGTLTDAGLIGGNPYNGFSNENIFTSSNFGSPSKAFLADQLLPFDISIIGLPEYGAKFGKRLIIHGVEIMTEASGTSIDDLVIEKQHSFIAKNISDWVSLDQIGGATGTGTQG